MSPMAGALVLLWVVVVFLIAVVAALLREVRRLQAQPRAAAASTTSTSSAVVEVPENLRPRSGARLSAVLLAVEGCRVCEASARALANWAESTDRPVSVAVLAGSNVSQYDARLSLIVDPRAHARMYPGWAPALAVIDGDGTIRSMEPVGSDEAFHAAILGLERVLADQHN